MSDLVMTVDVGTASTRAGVLDNQGRLFGRAACPIRMNGPEANYAEHDSEDIRQSVCSASKDTREIAKAQFEAIKGISFDATCSLVVREVLRRQLSVTKTGDPSWDTSSCQPLRAHRS